MLTKWLISAGCGAGRLGYIYISSNILMMKHQDHHQGVSGVRRVKTDNYQIWRYALFQIGLLEMIKATFSIRYYCSFVSIIESLNWNFGLKKSNSISLKCYCTVVREERES